MTLNGAKVVEIAVRHHLRITIMPDGRIIGSPSELEKLNRLYKLAELPLEDLNELLEGGYEHEQSGY